MKIKQINFKGILQPTNRSKYTDLQLSLYYDSNRKHYWASIMPCSIGGFCMECSPFDGKSEVVQRVQTRRSKKTDQQAIDLFDASTPRYKLMFMTEEQKLAAADQPAIPAAVQTTLEGVTA